MTAALVDFIHSHGHELLCGLIGNLLPSHEIPEGPCLQTTGGLWKTWVGPKIFASSTALEQMSLS